MGPGALDDHELANNWELLDAVKVRHIRQTLRDQRGEAMGSFGLNSLGRGHVIYDCSASWVDWPGLNSAYL